MNDTDKLEELNFEQSLVALEKIVEKMNDESLDLDALIVLYEEGIVYLRLCQKNLAAAEMKVNLLTERLKEIQEGENG